MSRLLKEPLVHRHDRSLDPAFMTTVGEAPIEWSFEEQHDVDVIHEAFYFRTSNSLADDLHRTFWVPLHVRASTVWVTVDHDVCDDPSIVERLGQMAQPLRSAVNYCTDTHCSLLYLLMIMSSRSNVSVLSGVPTASCSLSVLASSVGLL